ncbi:MAG: DEAD/DEAH box helicase [Rickettsiales bacterium]|nr:DEAD/DEAH box helicase [Rickettsiales bacterium]
MTCFKDFSLPIKLYENLEKMEFKIPTPIQVQAIPPALEGQDVLGSAQTGTGKTGAFGIPLVAKLMNDPESAALVLLPTRELALQVQKSLQTFINKENIKTALLIGGEPMAKQYAQLKSKPRLIVATPGRVNDHLKRKTLKLQQTNFLVLDEVDRMLDMGFGIQLEEIMKYLVSERQTLMFTATLPQNIKKLAEKYLKSPVHISVGKSHAPAEKVKQENIKLADSEKFPRLLQELENRTGSILVFVGTKISADKMSVKLGEQGHNAKALHGDLQQAKRSRVIESFRQERCRILVATDVAARGLDIPHIAHVINYDLPQNPEDYIHRIGRTARAGAEGHAVNFVGSKDALKWKNIAKMMNPNAVVKDHGDNESNSRSQGKKTTFRRDRFSKQGDFKEKPRSRFGRTSTDESNSFSSRSSGEKPRSRIGRTSTEESNSFSSRNSGEKPRSRVGRTSTEGSKSFSGRGSSEKPKSRFGRRDDSKGQSTNRSFKRKSTEDRSPKRSFKGE